MAHLTRIVDSSIIIIQHPPREILLELAVAYRLILQGVSEFRQQAGHPNFHNSHKLGSIQTFCSLIWGAEAFNHAFEEADEAARNPPNLPFVGRFEGMSQQDSNEEDIKRGSELLESTLANIKVEYGEPGEVLGALPVDFSLLMSD